MLIRELYAVNASGKADASVAALAALCREHSLPVLVRIEQSRNEDAERHPPKSAMAVTLGYLRSQWPKLTAYVEHGQTRIDNNLTEQAIRPTKLGAKNWLFIGHPNAGKRAADP